MRDRQEERREEGRSFERGREKENVRDREKFRLTEKEGYRKRLRYKD